MIQLWNDDGKPYYSAYAVKESPFTDIFRLSLSKSQLIPFLIK